MIKVLLEQGGSFPETKEFTRKFKYPLCGIFLTALVISNAFKSENVYKIVTPRQLISYHTVDELVADEFKIFSRVTQFSYKNRPDNSKYYLNVDKTSVFLIYKHWSVFANSEFADYFEYSENATEQYLLETSQLHPNISKIFMEPIDLLKPLARVESIFWNFSKTIDFDIMANSLYSRFWKNQNDLILEDLLGCNKSAWILPNYLTQDISRTIQRSNKHSDVVASTYLRPFLCLRMSGLIPLSLQSQFAKMQKSGILDWWPKFINRTDLNKEKSSLPPTKPNMSGHTQVIFFIFCIGVSFGIISMLIESSSLLVKYIPIGMFSFPLQINPRVHKFTKNQNVLFEKHTYLNVNNIKVKSQSVKMPIKHFEYLK